MRVRAREAPLEGRSRCALRIPEVATVEQAMISVTNPSTVFDLDKAGSVTIFWDEDVDKWGVAHTSRWGDSAWFVGDYDDREEAFLAATQTAFWARRQTR